MKKVSLNKTFYSTFLRSPEDVLEQVGLIYISDHDLTIKRHAKGKKFIYKRRGKQIKNENRLKRIESLVIPPAWTETQISHLKNGHIQAVGRDEKSRKQYIYHPTWNDIRNQTKFYKMYKFGEVLPIIRARVNTDLLQKKWSRSKVIALVIRLMEETHIRIGNKQYAKRNETYGLTTLRKKHVDIENNNLVFEFVGKKGKEHKITLNNKRLVKLVNQCEEIPGWDLFKYFDEDNVKQTVDSTMINNYIHEASGQFFTAKDFRTWSASLICFERLKKYSDSKTKKARKKSLLKAIDYTSKKLGNTRSVSRNYYIHPSVISSYKKQTLDKHLKSTEKSLKKIEFFTSSENSLLKLIENYTPTVKGN